MNIVKVNNLQKSYGQIRVIDDLSLKIKKGEIYGLLGPNGAGKSTFTNLLCKAVKRDEGEVYIFGKNIDDSIKEIKRRIGVVPQNVAIYEDLTAEENISFFASLYGMRGPLLKERVREALQFVGLDQDAGKYPKTFSGGMKRRLNIACALAHEPELIIMDEPTVGVDPQSRNSILRSIRKLNERGVTIIYTSHYMEEVELLCTRVGIIDHGKLIAEGTIEDLESIVTDRKTICIEIRSEEAVGIEFVEKLRLIKGVINVVVNENQFLIDSVKEADILAVILNHFLEDNLVISNIEMKGINLETAFLSMTGRSLRG